MDMSVVGGVMHEQTKTNTLEKVNISLMKTSNEQAEQQAAQILQSVAPDTSSPEGNKGHNVNTAV